MKKSIKISNQDILTDVICDCCGKVIKPDSNRNVRYFDTCLCHNNNPDVGSDTYKYFDICSIECVNKTINNWYEKYSPKIQAATFERKQITLGEERKEDE